VQRIDFPVAPARTSFEHISRDEWFGQFAERKPAFLYEEKACGEGSKFSKLVSRDAG
jgi:hypothetical protein